MSDDTDSNKPIDPQKCLRMIAATAPIYAQAKGNRIYCDEYRKSLKAILMQEAQTRGVDSAVGQEREAYADPKYVRHLEALREAVVQEESLRWKMVAAEAAVEVWRSQEASNRMMDRGTQ